MSIDEIKALEDSMKTDYGFAKEEIRFVMRFKPTFLFNQETGQHQDGIAVLKNFLVEKYGYDMELVRTLVVKYPYILSKDQEQLEGVFTLLESKGIERQETMKLIFECPKLLSVNLELAIEETLYLFDLYHKMGQQEIMELFRSFPYLFCCDRIKMRYFLAEFRKYRFSNEQILHICKNSNGLLASKVSNFRGFFDYLKIQHGIKASKVIEILDTYPEFVMQNRRDLL